MVLEIGKAERAEGVIRGKLERGERLMGFGHRVYRVRDPRADVLSLAAERFYATEGNRDLYELARAVEQTALRLLAQHKPDRRLDTNVASYIDIHRLCNAPETVIIDPMHGSGARWVESFLDAGRLQTETIRANRDPLFGGVNPEPIDRNLGSLKTRVVETKALLGLATDGDADRVGVVNEMGETMTMHDVVPLLLLHLARNRKMTGGVVRTFSQSVLLKRIAAAHNLKLYETPIGFKYIAELMLTDDILIGAEESGGIGVKGHIPERDGILNSLLFLEAVVTAGRHPSEMLRDLHREFGEFHFGRRDLRMEVEQGQELVTSLASNPPAKFAGYAVEAIETLDGTKLVFEDESWLLFRQSGTEPVLRIYAEATTLVRMNELLDGGEKLIYS
jgi:phosphomannomutase